MRGVSARFMLVAVAAAAAAYFMRSGAGGVDADALARYGTLVRVGLFAAATLVAAGTVRDVPSAVGMAAIVLACGTAFEFAQPGGATPGTVEIALNAAGAALGAAVRAGSVLLVARRTEAVVRAHVMDAFDDAVESEAGPDECRDAARRAYGAIAPDAGDAEIEAALERWLGPRAG